jgi:hypothetical protein
MAGMIGPKVFSGPLLKQAQRRFTNASPVLGADGNPAVGRVVLMVGKNEFATWIIKGSAVIDSSGNYSIAAHGAGPNDKHVLLAIGDFGLGEHARALNNMTGVI